MKEETKIIHSVPVDELTGAISVPIYQTSTYVQEAPGVNKGFDYSRTSNPTRKELEKIVATLENGYAGFAFSSGLAAIDSIIKLLKSGDEILAVNDIYGGTYRLFTHTFQKLGINVNYTDTSNLTNVINNINKKTRFVWIESPTNPTLKISDIEEISKIAHSNGAKLVVDNTFASPILQKPIELGADIVIHSATKYLAGHSDLIAGLVVVNDAELAEEIKFNQNATGSILGPFDSWLVIRGIQTIFLRVSKQCENAFKVALLLQKCRDVEEVFYPGLVSHPNHFIAKKQQKAFGSIVSFTLKDDTTEAATEFVKSTKLFKLAESLGGVKSLICLPSEMTHKSVPFEIRRASGIKDSLIRLSVGIENADDLTDDLKLAFEKLKRKPVFA